MDAEELKLRLANLIRQARVNQLDKIMHWMQDRVTEYQESGYNVLNTLQDFNVNAEEMCRTCNRQDVHSTFHCICGRQIMANITLNSSSYERSNYSSGFDELSFNDSDLTDNRNNEGVKRRRMERLLSEKFGGVQQSSTMEENSETNPVLNNALIGQIIASQIDSSTNLQLNTAYSIQQQKQQNEEQSSSPVPEFYQQQQHNVDVNDQNNIKNEYLEDNNQNQIRQSICSSAMILHSLSSETTRPVTTKARKSKYLSSYLPAWEQEFNKDVCWLQRSLQEGHAYCMICSREILIKHMGKSAILQHMKGRLHRNRFEQITSKKKYEAENGTELIDLSVNRPPIDYILKDASNDNSPHNNEST